ncbi:MAG TPA: PA14 domain-containing protein, partial [Vicinamibacterales bacterium]|nr:PA14 domain-containing protein [Vicinamibacterales bacterium]
MTRAVQIAACILVGLAAFAAGRLTLPETGLRGQYFTNLTRSGPPVASSIDRAVSTDGLARGTAAAWTTYSVEWSGAIVIDRDGEYVFATVSDDGSEMDVAGQTVVRNGGLHGPQEASGRITLAAGVHPVHVRYEQAGGGFHLELKYALGESPLSVIPDGILLPQPMSRAAYRARNALPFLSAFVAMLLFVASQRLPVRVRPATSLPFRAWDRPAVAIGVIVIVAVSLRIVMMFGSNGILWGDSDVFLDTFGAIRRGQWFEHDPFRTLLYPYFLAPFLLWSTEKPMDQVIVGA